MKSKKDEAPVRLNRRMFVGLIGAAAAALAVRQIAPTVAPEGDRSEPERSPWAGKTRWIGHC